MTISVRCSECAKKYTVKDEAAGKSFKCKDCGATLAVPAAKPRPDEDAFEDYEDDSFEAEAPAPRRSKKPTAGSRGGTTKKKSAKSSSGGSIVFIGGAVLGAIVLLAGLGIAVSKLGLGSSWVDYSHPDGSFKIKFPKQPKVQALGHGAELSHNITCETSSGACTVEFVDLTAALRQSGQSLSAPGMSDVFFENVMIEAAVKRGINQPLQATPITFRGFPGREVEIKMNGLSNTMRMYLCGDGFYSLQYVRKQDAPRSADMDRFFNSFDPAAGRGTTTPGSSNSVATTTQSTQSSNPNDPYLTSRNSFQSTLVKQGPAPQDWKPETPPEGVKEILYPSGQMQLKAWVTEPVGTAGAKQPAVVYFHGGFAFTSIDFQACEPFRQRGFAVMTPMLRGENGNPGNYELFWGEVDDAKAAVQWLAKQPHVDANRIYAFGHNVGGGISSLLTLHDDIPLRHSGSASGLYTTDSLVTDLDVLWKSSQTKLPFRDVDLNERRLRVLIGNQRDMKRSHVAYYGVSDSNIQRTFAQLEADQSTLAKEVRVNKERVWLLIAIGDEVSCRDDAMLSYARVCEKDARSHDANISAAPPSLETQIDAVKAEKSIEYAEKLENTAAVSKRPATDYVLAAQQWLRVKDKARALAAAKKAEATATESFKHSATYHWHKALGELFLKTGEPKSAIPYLEKAIEKAASDEEGANCRKLLAEAKAKAGV